MPKSENSPLVSVTSVFNLPDDLRMKVTKWYIEQQKYQWMSKRLEEEGFSVHPSKLYHWCKNNLAGLTDEEGPIEGSTDAEHLALERTALSLALSQCIKAVRDAKIPKPTTIKEIEQLCAAISRLVQAAVHRDRIALEANKAIDKVRDQFKAEIQRQLSGNPELCDKLTAEVDRAADEHLLN